MANLKRWSRGEIIRMRSEVDRLFDDLCADFDLPVMVCRMAGDLELYEEGNVLVVRLELGNMSPDDVLVSVSDTRLTVSAKSVGSRIGRSRLRTFRRELRLPCVVRRDEVLAEFEDGILVIRLPKSTTQLGQNIEIAKK
ncbi:MULTISPECIES: Hsp20/alpha crystallin family protein [unclassified Pseudodesulfovibrio]|uniref:Hsp20/alpha crystallin family protein n=1 Tax=unclassified Pseudodesulfovibrio TaxID=2661612 RepID=UPI000FEB8FD8|nr:MULTISPECIES: Hsp20/alpha crystallin family protein [unclassified Pseudodesulfovibrio]MCJ2163788.1 Hsp20/alpha crystallin family protein [Pseudodesulfovibrio sp. S3-i]RWU05963.1 Hsp20/alpha crystallin family protein [Pseudodesulfovibrio sp. S3]